MGFRSARTPSSRHLRSDFGNGTLNWREQLGLSRHQRCARATIARMVLKGYRTGTITTSKSDTRFLCLMVQSLVTTSMIRPNQLWREVIAKILVSR
jgi:hypothetical protein